MRTDLVIEGVAGAAAAILTVIAVERVRPAEKLENTIRENTEGGPPPRRRPRPRIPAKVIAFLVGHIVFRGVMAGTRAVMTRGARTARLA